jgi:hypothetical protein
MMLYRFTLLLSLTAAACGGDDDDASDPDGGPDVGEDGGGGGGGDGCGDATDITCAGLEGTWRFENASKTRNTISHGGDLHIAPGGELFVAFSEPDEDMIFDQDILVTSRPECEWGAPSPMTEDTEVQNAYPSIVGEGDTLHMVWSGYPEGNNHVYYSANSGSGWSERVNLTGEDEIDRHAYSPALSIGPGGEIAIAYLSAPVDPDTGGFDGPSEVKVALLEADTLAGPPVTVIPATGDGCFDPRAIHDAEGNLHVLAECGAVLDLDIIWATDAGGDWADEPMPMTADHADMSISLAFAGGTVHAAWGADLPCTAGTCRNILYTQLDGAEWTAPVIASQEATPGDFSPSLAVNDAGHVFIAFHRDNVDSKSDVYITSSIDGIEFAAPCNLTRTDAENEWMPSSLQFHPDTGALHLLFETFVPDSDPLDTEITHAFLVADETE